LKKALLAATLMVLVLASSAFAAGIGDLPWDQSNIETLRSFDKTAIDGYLNDLAGDDPLHAEVGAFGWYDLNGDGHYDLVVTEDLSGRAHFDYLAIYGQSNSGTVQLIQWIEGDRIPSDLGKVVQDLNGDGKDELIIPATLVSYTTASTITWPEIYRLLNGKYVEASSDFPAYYDSQVLPLLERKINAARNRSPLGWQDETQAAAALMVKAKILRVLGRDPNAGVLDANVWMQSDNPELLQYAIATFGAIGGHDSDIRIARAAQSRAVARERAVRQGG
jgi:VCBS repeat protein